MKTLTIAIILLLGLSAAQAFACSSRQLYSQSNPNAVTTVVSGATGGSAQ